tara:strand:+ start:34 stop:288 length:255 start_codon:yes stop_codon:yes gene_type:complete
MKHITREELILEFCQFTADKMDEETLKNIAVVTLIANIKGENEEGSTYADWEDYVARKDGLHKSEDLLDMIKPAVNMVERKNEG